MSSSAPVSRVAFSWLGCWRLGLAGAAVMGTGLLVQHFCASATNIPRFAFLTTLPTDRWHKWHVPDGYDWNVLVRWVTHCFPTHRHSILRPEFRPQGLIGLRENTDGMNCFWSVIQELLVVNSNM